MCRTISGYTSCEPVLRMVMVSCNWEARMSEKGSASRTSVDEAVSNFAAKIQRAGTRRVGSLLLRMTGKNGGDYYVHASSTGCRVSREAGAEPPHVEVIGDARRIRA